MTTIRRSIRSRGPDRGVASIPMIRTEERRYEYACHESNYALDSVLRGARCPEKER
jgi:hypothetical protein